MSEGAAFAGVLDYLARDIVTTLEGVDDAALNRSLDLPEANSMFAIATHTLQSGRWWVLQHAGGQPIERDRAGEFVASGTGEELRRGFEGWVAELHGVLDSMPDGEMTRVTDGPWFRAEPARRVSVRDCILHAIEHTAIHLGHLQITRQVVTGGSELRS
jgi:hypothetical protein